MDNHGISVPSIYVACLASYNSGILYGKWIKLNSDSNIVYKEIFDMLDDSPIPNAEEWEIHDYDVYGVSSSCLSYIGVDELCKLVDFVNEYGELAADVYMHEDLNMDAAIDAMENKYCGEYDSELQFAEQLFDEIYLHDIPDSCHYYIDYEAFKRDIMINDYYSIDVNGSTHIFNQH